MAVKLEANASKIVFYDRSVPKRDLANKFLCTCKVHGDQRWKSL